MQEPRISLLLDNQEFTISRAVASKIPVLEPFLDEDRKLFLDRDAELFGAVLLYAQFDIFPSTTEEQRELEHYGFVVDSADSQKAEQLADQIETDEPFFVLTADNKLIVTTKQRLSEINFFKSLFARDWVESCLGSTCDDPYHIDITSSIFRNILSHLRGNCLSLCAAANQVLDMWCGLASDESGPKVIPGIRQDSCSAGWQIDLAAKGAFKSDLSRKATTNPFMTPQQGHHSFATSIRRIPFKGGCFDLHGRADFVQNFFIEFYVPNPVATTGRSPPWATTIFRLVKFVRLEILGRSVAEYSGLQLHQLALYDPHSVQRRTKKHGLLHVPFDPFLCADNPLPLGNFEVYHHGTIVIRLELDETLLEKQQKRIELSGIVKEVYLDGNYRRNVPTSFSYYWTMIPYRGIVADSFEAEHLDRVFTIDLPWKHFTSVIFFSLHRNGISGLVSVKLLRQAVLSFDGFPRKKLFGDDAASSLEMSENNIRYHDGDEAKLYAMSFSNDPFDYGKPRGGVSLNGIRSKRLVIKTASSVDYVHVWGLHMNEFVIAPYSSGLRYKEE